MSSMALRPRQLGAQPATFPPPELHRPPRRGTSITSICWRQMDISDHRARRTAILSSTDRTAADAVARLHRPRGVRRARRAFPTGASQAFYEHCLGLVRSPTGPPHAVVFDTRPIAFALRDITAGTDLASVVQPGIGVAIWLHATDVQAIHDALAGDGRTARATS